MKLLIIKYLLILIVVVTTISLNNQDTQDSQPNCPPHDRWSVKTLSDKESGKIVFKPVATTIQKLQLLSLGKKWSKKLPRTGFEFNTYKIKCGIREYRKEADNDIHLVLYDLKDSTKTIVGEIPNLIYTCDQSNKYKPLYDKALAEFKKYKLPKNKIKTGTYEITGVCFFDKKHGQLGMSENGIELHPIIKFKKVK